jgi:hypothetical protein
MEQSITKMADVLLTALQQNGYGKTESEKMLDRMFGEVCVKYEQLRECKGSSILTDIYGPLDPSDNYFHEKWGKFVRSGYPFACHLDGGNRPRFGKAFREYIAEQEKYA